MIVSEISKKSQPATGLRVPKSGQVFLRVRSTQVVTEVTGRGESPRREAERELDQVR